MENRTNPTALFVADTHFKLNPDRSEERRLERFLAFLDHARHVDHIILLGDIFDFWFDYPHFRLRGYESLLLALDRIRDAGTAIHFVGGNHDIWAAGYLHQRYGSEPGGGPFTLQLGSRRLRLVHGDGLLSHDWIYNSFRAIVRNRLGIAVGKTLHPELLYALCIWLSGRSRRATRDEAEQIVAKAERFIRSQANVDWDLMIMGHIHHPFVVQHAGRSLVGLGGWLGQQSYGQLDAGEFALHDFAAEPPSALPAD